MNWISKTNLLFKSLLAKEEKKLLDYATNLYQAGKGYKISNYEECKRFVKISYKLGDRMDYLCNIGKLNSDEYNDTKYKYQFVDVIIKEFSMSS